MAIGDLVHFDGVNDYLTRGGGLTGAADGKQGAVSLWLTVDTLQRVAWSTSVARFQGQLDASGAFKLTGRNSSATVVLEVTSSVDLGASAGIQHVFVTFDLTDSGKRALVIDGVEDSAASWSTYTNDFIEYATNDWSIGARINGNSPWHGCMGEFWFDDQYLDPATYLSKFYAGGGPVDLGSDGSAPTGSAPLICLNKDVATWHVNAGTGGGFTEQGALTACAANFPAPDIELEPVPVSAEPGPMAFVHSIPLLPAELTATPGTMEWVGAEVLLLEPASADAQPGTLLTHVTTPLDAAQVSVQPGTLEIRDSISLDPVSSLAQPGTLLTHVTTVLDDTQVAAQPGTMSFFVQRRILLDGTNVRVATHILRGGTYADWLAQHTAARIMLVDLVADDGTTYRIASQTYITEPDEAPPNVVYDGRVMGSPSVEWRWGAVLGRRGTANGGELAVANPDGKLDDWPSKRWKSATYRYGDPAWRISSFKPFFHARVQGVESGDELVEFSFRDRYVDLKNPILSRIMSFGPHLGKLAPLCYGQVHNIQPPVSDPDDDPEYIMNETGPVEDACINRYANQAKFSSPAVTKRNSTGGFELHADPGGAITVDAKGYRSGGVWLRRMADIIEHALTRVADDTVGIVRGGSANTIVLAEDASDVDGAYVDKEIRKNIPNTTGEIHGQFSTCVSYDGESRTATVSPNWSTTPQQGDAYRIEDSPQQLGPMNPADLDSDAFATFRAEMTETIGLYIESSNMSAEGMLDEVLSPAAWHRMTSEGKLAVGLLKNPDAEPADLKLGAFETREEIRRIAEDPPAKRIRLGWRKNHTVARGSGGNADAGRMAFVSEKYRYHTRGSFRPGEDQEYEDLEIETPLTFSGAALRELDRVWDLLSVPRSTYQVPAFLEVLADESIHVLEVSDDRQELDEKNLVLMGVQFWPLEGVTELEVWG